MPSRVVLGLGSCVDRELTLTSGPLEHLVREYGIRAAELGAVRPVRTGRDLVVSVLTHLAGGAGGEQFVASAAALQSFADRFVTRTTLGGSSVRAALTLDRLGVPTTLHLVSIDDDVRRLLPPSVTTICSAEPARSSPHVIVQYARGLRVRAGDVDVRAPSADRLIYVNDPANENLVLSEDLGEALREADVFLISGFNAMRDPQLLGERLATLQRHLRQLPAGALVVFEDAAYHEPGFGDRVRQALLPRIDVYGMNEDELQSHLGRAVDLLSAPDVAEALADLRRLLPGPTLVVHTRYWATALGPRAAGSGPALERAVVTAGTRYAFGDEHTAHHRETVRQRPRRPDAVRFAADLEAGGDGELVCRPAVALDVATPTTIGLGDTFVGGFLAALVGDPDARHTHSGRVTQSQSRFLNTRNRTTDDSTISTSANG